MHSTSTNTLNGTLVYKMQSEGVGSMKAGVAGEFDRECVECKPKEDYKGGGIEDERLRAGLESGQYEQKLVAGFQVLETHIQASGEYSSVFLARIEGPK
jgi:hypothetical protein